MSRNRRIARFGLLPLMAGAALSAAAGPAFAAVLPEPGGLPAAGGLVKPDRLVKPEIYRPDGARPCLHALPLCLPDRSQFEPIPHQAS